MEATFGVEILQTLARDIDMEHFFEMDNIAPAHTAEDIFVAHLASDGLLHAGKSERNHKMEPVIIIYMSIMVIGLHIDHLFKVYLEHFACYAEIQGIFLHGFSLGVKKKTEKLRRKEEIPTAFLFYS